MKRHITFLELVWAIALCALVPGCASGPFSDDYAVSALKKEDPRVSELFTKLSKVCEASGLTAKQTGFPSLWYFRDYDPKKVDDRASYLHLLCDYESGRLLISIRSDCPECPANAKFRTEIEEVVRSMFPGERLQEQHAKIIKTFGSLQKKADPVGTDNERAAPARV